MSRRPAPLLLAAFLSLSFLAHAGVPVVTVEPACPQAYPRKGEPKIGAQVTIRYNPRGYGAVLKDASAMNVLVGGYGPGWGDTLLRVPMTRRSDGVWEAAVQPKNIWIYMIYYFQDGSGRLDDNRMRYWETLGCDNGAVVDQAVSYQAKTHTGDVINSSISRKVDYGRAVKILESDIQANPHHEFNLLADLWRCQVKRYGDDGGAWRKVSREVERFIQAHKNDSFMLTAAGNIMDSHNPLTPRARQKYLEALRPFAKEYKEFKRSQDFSAAQNEQDPATQVKLFRQYLADYPDDEIYALATYPLMFRTEAHDPRGLNDLAAGEETFRAWAKADPASPDPYAAMAHVYIQRGEKLDEADRLLARAFELYTGERPKGRRLFVTIEVGFRPESDRARLRFLRGQLRVAQKRPQEGLPDLAEAVKVFPDRQDAWFALGQAQEGAGMKEQAVASYIEAATVPAQQESAAREALDRMFAADGPEGAAKLEQKLLDRIAERRQKASAEYTPTPIDRPLPDFRITTLAGREVTAKSLRGRPAVVNVWAAWCAGCMIELPWFEELQKKHGDVTVLAIAWQSKPDDVRRIAGMKKLNALGVAISDALERELGDSGVPSTFVIDRKGRIRFVHSDLPDVVAVLEKDLAYLDAEK